MFHKWQRNPKHATRKKNIKISQQTGANHFHVIARSQRQNGNTRNYHKESVKFNLYKLIDFFCTCLRSAAVDDVDHFDAEDLDEVCACRQPPKSQTHSLAQNKKKTTQWKRKNKQKPALKRWNEQKKNRFTLRPDSIENSFRMKHRLPNFIKW